MIFALMIWDANNVRFPLVRKAVHFQMRGCFKGFFFFFFFLLLLFKCRFVAVVVVVSLKKKKKGKERGLRVYEHHAK